MNSIRKLWWVGAVALIAACDPYDDENKGAPSVISAFASNAEEASEGTLVGDCDRCSATDTRSKAYM